MPQLMAAKNFDFQNKKIVYDPEIYNVLTKEWVREIKPPLQKKPSIIEGHKKLNTEVLSISFDKLTGYISIGVEHVSPIEANKILQLIINNLNQISKLKALEDSNRAIEFLLIEYEKTSNMSLKNAINNLSEIELKNKMLAEISDQYLLKIIDSPFVPELKSKPSRALICILGFLIGLIFSLIWIAILEILKRKKF